MARRRLSNLMREHDPVIDVLALLCLLDAPEACATRTVPVGAATCEAALAAAAPRLDAWRRDHAVSEVRCGALAEPPVDFEEVAPGVFVHLGAVAIAGPENGGRIGNVAFVVGREAVAVIDAGGSRAEGEGIVAAVRAVTDLPIRAAILTHGHPDHVFGATALADAGAEVLGHARLAAALSARAEPYLAQGSRQIGPAFAGTAMPEAIRGIGAPESLDLGGRSLELVPWPEAHSEADLTALDPGAGILFAGDLVVEGHIPTLDGSLAGWLEALDALGALPATRVVPGHGGPILPWPEAAAPVRRYLGALETDLRAALDRGEGIGEAAATAAAAERDSWALFDEHNLRNATVAYAELEWE